MRPLILIIPLLIISCTPRENRSYEDRQYNLLGEIKDNKGRLLKRVESGWIPGEDIWLKITKYDTIGNVIEEYGALTYGTKYKNIHVYDEKNRLIEKRSYSFRSKNNESSEFENYGPKDGYELKDTLVDFSVTDKQLEYKIVYTFDDKNEMTREFHYDIEFDSATNEIKQLLTLDTLLMLDNAYIFKNKK
jgi:hypothetical protein